MPVPSNRLLDLAPGVGQVASTIRFEVLTSDLESVGPIRVIGADSISGKSSGNVKRQLSGFKLDERALRTIDPFSMRIKPWWVLEDGTEWPCGVFVFTYAAARLGTYVDLLDTTMLDQDYVLDQGTRATFGVKANGNILDAVRELIGQTRITYTRMPEASTAQAADPIVWPSGTSRLRILNELCVLAGWLPPYFDNDGALVIRSAPDLDNDPPDHTYTSTHSRVVAKSIVDNDNMLDAPNVYIVIGSGPSTSEVVGIAQVAAELPFSVENRRFEVVHTERVQGIESNEQAQRMAQAMAAAAGNGFRNVQFDGFPDPRHDLFDTAEWDQVMFRESTWNLRLTPAGPHSHTLTRGGFQ